MSRAKEMKPQAFFKCKGSKRRIIKQLIAKIPDFFKEYYEPFLGGGSLFFHLSGANRVCRLSDTNSELIGAYQSVRDDPEGVLHFLEEHRYNHSKEHYNYVRSLFSIENKSERAARFIYLMKTAINGDWVVDKEGRFLGEMGKVDESIRIKDEEIIYLASEALKNNFIDCMDFINIRPEKDDFVYLDPPSHTKKKKIFKGQFSDGFSEEDHLKVRDFALQLSSQGAKVMITSEASSFIDDIYIKDFRIERVMVCRSAYSQRSMEPTESIITNY